nr:hypothetical protein K-LCC10_0272 [Kaumoebavirus]
MDRACFESLCRIVPREIALEIEEHLNASHQRDHKIWFEKLWEDISPPTVTKGDGIHFLNPQRIDFIYKRCRYCGDVVYTREFNGEWLSSSHNERCTEWLQDHNHLSQYKRRGRVPGRNVVEAKVSRKIPGARTYLNN